MSGIYDLRERASIANTEVDKIREEEKIVVCSQKVGVDCSRVIWTREGIHNYIHNVKTVEEDGGEEEQKEDVEKRNEGKEIIG